MDEQRLKKAEKFLSLTENPEITLLQEIEDVKSTVEGLDTKLSQKIDVLIDGLKKKLAEELQLEIAFNKSLDQLGKNLLSIRTRTVALDGLVNIKGEKGDKGDRGNDGKDGKDGKNGNDGKDGKADKGKDGTDGVDGKDGKAGSPDTPEMVRDKLETLEGDERLDAKYIKNLPEGNKGSTIVVQSQNPSTVATNGIVPIGGVVGWLKSFSGTPTLPAQFVECNGQVLSDTGSPYNGGTIPNLNASGGGTKRFLRGSTTSGTTGGADTYIPLGTVGAPVGSTTSTGGVSISLAATTHTHTFTGTSAGYLPSYYEVVYVIRIK